MNEYLFTYGLLRRKTQHEMGRYLEKNARFISEATFQGKLYLIDYYPGVVPSENPTDKVQGEIFEISNQKLLDTLDFFEGIGPGFPQPHEYIRQLQEVTLADQTILLVWIYLFNRPIDGFSRIESGEFISCE